MADSKIVIGEIKGAHGVRGLVRVAVFAEDLSLFNRLTAYKITLKNRHKNEVWLAHIEGIDNKEDADALKGIKLFCNRDDLAEISDDEIYHADLIGMECVDENGETIGIVEAIENFGAGDLLDIKPPKGHNFYLSYDDKTVLSIDDKITVSMPEVI